MVQLLTLIWLFNATQPASSSLTQLSPHAGFAAPRSTTNGFTIKLKADLQPPRSEQVLLEIPQVLRVLVRQHDPTDRRRQNYPAFRMPDGSVPVLEATLAVHSVEHPAWTNLTLGVPLAILRSPMGEHEVVLHFTGVRWTLYVDGELLDNEFPFGYPRWAESNSWKLTPEVVRQADLFFPALKPEAVKAPEAHPAPGIQYWLPRGHNNWVGDVATLFHKGRYHVFYLYDRRHHQSKFGCGAHYFEHLSTTDFRTWTEHEAATPLEEQWECIGTGTPFVFRDQLCLGYGLHTTRVYPQERTALPAQWEYLRANGRTGRFQRNDTPGVPAGSTYAVSSDGVSNFRKSGVLFHPCENPSVYRTPEGALRLLANFHSKGIWESDAVDGGWRCVSPEFPPGGDCTFFFRWGRFDYIIGGFSGLWSKSAEGPDSAYEDQVRKGLDFYDGLNVPSITEVGGGRVLMAGWIPIGGWGGNLVLRELIQFPDGRIGSKWMPEITPATEAPRELATRVVDVADFPAEVGSFLLTFNVRPTVAGSGRIGVSLLPEVEGKEPCELQISLGDLRAQFSPGSATGFGRREKSLREGGAPHSVGNYAVENLMGVDKSFTVRLLVLESQKTGGVLVDAEIAGKRTMISHRPGLTVRRLGLRTEGVELGNVQVSTLRAPYR